MVDFPRLNFILSNVNAALGSGLGYMDDRNMGYRNGTAEINLGLNLANGVLRNTMAYDISRRTGSNLGYLVNNLAGYGSPEANAMGTYGLFGAAMMTQPWGCGGYSSYGCTPYSGFGFGYSTFGGSSFGGCGYPSMATPPFFGGYMSGGYYC